MKMLLKTRPYEIERGATDAVYQAGLEDVGAALACGERLAQGAPARDRARPWRGRATGSAPCRPRYDRRGPSSAWSARSSAASTPSPTPTSSRLVEEQGGECWLADIGEWVWYTDDEHAPAPHRRGAQRSRENARARCSRPPSSAATSTRSRAVRRRLRRLRRAASVRAGARPRLAVPAVRRRARRDGAQHRQGRSTCTARAPTASSTSARSPA